MRMRYIHIKEYPPLQDVEICFSSEPLLNRECAIRFVVGVNGSGKSNLLRAITEVFLALADQRPPHFPVSLVYELGREKQKRTIVLECPGSRAASSLWIADGFAWPVDTSAETFSNVIERLRTNDDPPAAFKPLISPGNWPSGSTTPLAIALPRAVLAYTTGDLKPWHELWRRGQDTSGIEISSQKPEYDFGNELPADWSKELESALPETTEEKRGGAFSSGFSNAFDIGKTVPAAWRPILVNPLLLKCALLAVALPHGLEEISGNLSKSRKGNPDSSKLLDLLARGCWKKPVTISFRMNYKINTWRELEARRAREWILSAGEVISEPKTSYRTLYFDKRGPFSATALEGYTNNDELLLAKNQGEALIALLGGFKISPYDRFERLKELIESGFIEDIRIGVSRTDMSDVLRFDEFSDGEQMVLGRMALFQLLANEDDAFLLLDEPETHFNDKWKREIVDIIDSAIGRTANDVLIATHTAIVLTDVFNDEIVLMERQDNNAKARTVKDNTFASDPSEVMIRVFGAEDSVGQRAREYIETLLKQTHGSPDDIRRLITLVERLGSGFYRTELRTLLKQWE